MVGKDYSKAIPQHTAQALLKINKSDITHLEQGLGNLKQRANMLWQDCDKAHPDEAKFEELNFYRDSVRAVKKLIAEKAALSRLLKSITRSHYNL